MRCVDTLAYYLYMLHDRTRENGLATACPCLQRSKPSFIRDRFKLRLSSSPSTRHPRFIHDHRIRFCASPGCGRSRRLDAHAIGLRANCASNKCEEAACVMALVARHGRLYNVQAYQPATDARVLYIEHLCVFYE
jgi:hypothetical protein